MTIVCQFSKTNSTQPEFSHEAASATALPTTSNYTGAKLWSST